MRESRLRALRNRLQAQACQCNIWSVEYSNLERRIKLINQKLMSI